MSRRHRLPVFLTSISLLGLALASPVLAAPPGNDDIASPTVVPSIPYSNSQDTSEATQGPTDPDCDGAGPTVWYAYTPGENVRLEANTFGSDYDTTLYVGTPDGAGGIDLIGCNDDAGNSVQSRLRFDAEAGVTYLFMAGSFDGGPGGDLVFNLGVAPPPQPLELSLSVDPVGKFTPSGDATIQGTVNCSGADFLFVDGSLSQQVGRVSTVGGEGGAELQCEADVSFVLTITPFSGLFRGGLATAQVTAYGCSDEECAESPFEGSIRLRH